jgi:hypothetical protein
LVGVWYVVYMFGKGEKREDKYAFRGDADTFDTDMLGPGHVPEPGEGSSRSERLWDSYNWAGDETNAWERLPGKGGKS